MPYEHLIYCRNSSNEQLVYVLQLVGTCNEFVDPFSEVFAFNLNWWFLFTWVAVEVEKVKWKHNFNM